MRRRDRIALVLVASVLVVAPFALGGAPRWAVCSTSALAALGAGSFISSKREMTALSPLLAFVALAALLTLLQVLPLPAGLVAVLSPSKHELVVENARSLGESAPAWIAISLDPPATLVELAKLCGYAAFAYSALRLAANAARREWLLVVLAATGAAMAATALAHIALGAESVFGIYRPREAMIRPTLAPFLNHNHLSAFMAFSAPVALGLAITSSGRQRLGWGSVVALCAGVGLLAESRGGAIALVAGLVTVGVFTAMQRRGLQQASRLKRSDVIAIAIVAMSGLALLGLLTAGGVARDLSGTRMSEVSQVGSRFQVWRETSALLDEYRFTGVGRGAFESVATRIHDSSTVVYPHVENEYLQAVVDWGLPGSAVLALVLIWLATIAARNARTSALEAGAFGGLVALAIENLNDFSLWMPGIAYPAIAAIAVLTWVPLAETTAAKRIYRPSRLLALSVVAAVVVLASTPIGDPIRKDTAELARAATSAPNDRANIARAAAVWNRHPSSYAAAGMVAQALFVARDRRAIPVANRALTLHPTSGELHRLVARMLLASQQRAQARTEFALALKYRFTVELLDEVVRAYADDEDLTRALPLEPTLIKELASRLVERGRAPAALKFMQRYLGLHPQDTRVLVFASNLALSLGDVPLALALAQQAHRTDPTAEAIIALSRSLTKSGQAAEALTLLQRAIEQGRLPPHARFDVLLVLAQTQTEQAQYDAARQTLHAALPHAVGRQAAEIHRQLADIEERSGNRHQADWERHRAEELER